MNIKGKGRPRKKGETIKLQDLFTSRKSEFVEATVRLYGKEETVRYLCLNLLWGQKLYQELRFVLVMYGEKTAILVTTKLDLDPVNIIELYSFRFKIECTFRELKQVMNGFGYQFWSKAMPKLRRYAKKGMIHPLEEMEDEKEKELILSALKAIEGFVMCSCIAMGMLQMLSLTFSTKINESPVRFLRTKSNPIVSEATVAYYLRKTTFSLFSKTSRLCISRIMKKKQSDPFFDEDLKAS
ncbi:hypothetical protein LC087_06905 [Bacillus carboniphilus]|uniref:Transposase IS4-like domain-containing protein n=1 Tax=Bacillus carboniphilus TaxID=86663 RepID=A0ABY9JYI9_9BACI|nr:hypothetical protein [Bacillus carboniphilus]WLR43844.1 hypothetical protein LC087_06905 [Bacillus carboniphilus]